MEQVVGVRFKTGGKVYYFRPLDFKIDIGDKVIVETSLGVECGNVVLVDKKVEEESLVKPLKNILRVADYKDLKTLEEKKLKEKQAEPIFNKKVSEHKLKMKLMGVEYAFDGSKVIFSFTSEGRVDFRELVKSFANIFKTRIELKQIGVRDEAKIIGGLGICGKTFCCKTFLSDFHPVSIKMAKDQNLSLNPVKISGTCGRLMCCLKYEQSVYEELLKITPKVGAIIKTDEGKGVVIDVDILKGKLKVKLDDKDIVSPKFFNKDEITVIKDGQIELDKKEIERFKNIEK
ncbi:MAG: PSP1 domain-containing protein [Oscillospiraceae bacterium]